jgi:hypothetical protein
MGFNRVASYQPFGHDKVMYETFEPNKKQIKYENYCGV